MHCREQKSNEISEQKANKIAGFGVSSLLMRVGFAHEIGESNGLSYIKIPNFSPESICAREQKAFETEKKRKQRASYRNGEFVPDFRDTCPQNEDSTRDTCPPYHNISYQNTSYQSISHQNTPEQSIPHQNTPEQSTPYQSIPEQSAEDMPDDFYPEEAEMCNHGRAAGSCGSAGGGGKTPPPHGDMDTANVLESDVSRGGKNNSPLPDDACPGAD